MASVAFKLTTSAKLNSIPKVDGQLVFVQPDEGQTVGKLYLDFHNKRTQYGSIGETPAPDQYATHYLGVSTTPPSSGTVTVEGDVVTPAWGDIVAYDGGMYLYNGTNWVEIGSSSGTPDQYVTHYRGIMDAGFDPTDSTTWFMGGQAFTPADRDIVAFGNKEFIYRDNGSGTLAFFELGDEDSQNWEIDE